MEDLAQFKSYEVKYKDAVYTINVFDLENDQCINAKASTLNLVIQEILEKYKDMQETDSTYLIRKRELEVLNKGRLEYKILYQRSIECTPIIDSTAATLTFTSNGTVVTGHVNSRDSRNLERSLYELMYREIIPSHDLKG